MARILFLGDDYYGYAVQIRDACRRLGHEVDYRRLQDRSFASNTFRKLAPDTYNKRLAAYHRDIVEKSAGQGYDTVLFVQAHRMEREIVERLKQLHPDARFVLYYWDSLVTHDYRPWLHLFDHAATFDPEDAKALDIAYLPLFAIPRFFDIDQGREKDFDLYFVGSIASLGRFDALARLHEFTQTNGLRTRFHMVANPIMRARLLRSGRRLPGLTGKGMGFGDIVDLLERSHGTFDFANNRQSGYTMRLIENMCANRKIVTENPRILREPFYREDRFLLVDGYDFSAVPDFLSRPIESELDTQAFSVDSWARQLVEP